MDEAAQLARLCRRLGAGSDAQAAVLAGQLLKRADQLAAERGIAREAALQHLISLLVAGRRGEVPPDFAPQLSE